MEITRNNLLGLIRASLKRDSLSVSGLERDAGVPKDTVRDFLRGKTQILRADKLQKILHIIEPEGKVHIAGIVGMKGAEITLLDKGNMIKENEVECPPGCSPSEVVALRVQGDALLPVFHNGWIIYYSRRNDIAIPPISGGWQVPYPKRNKGSDHFAEFIGKPCIVGLEGGHAYLGTLKHSANGKTYDITNHTMSDIKNISPVWVAKIIFIKVE